MRPSTATIAQRPEVLVSLMAGGTVHVRWSAGTCIEERHARHVLSRTHELTGASLSPMLVQLAGIGSPSAAAMTLFTDQLQVSRMALVGTSPVDSTIAAFFHTVHRPPYPARYFTSLPEALAWLAEPAGSLPHPGTGRADIPAPTSAAASAAAVAESQPPAHTPVEAPGPPQPDREAQRPRQLTPRRQEPARRSRLREKLTAMFTTPRQTAGDALRSGAGSEIPNPEPPARPVSAETLQQVTGAYHGKTRAKSFPRAVAVAAVLDYDHLGEFTSLLAQCPPAERDLIATHLYRHFLHSPRQLARWVKTAGHNYFHARAKVALTGIGRAPARPGKISTARQIDRDSAGFNVRQEARDAIALINGLVRSHWPGHIGLEAQHNIISLAASLARRLITAGDAHPLAGSYREYTDLYEVRYSIVKHGTGLIDLVLKHPEATGLLCEYIDSGRHASPDALRRAVLNSTLMLRQERSVPARN